MFSEFIHSVADTVNQVCMWIIYTFKNTLTLKNKPRYSVNVKFLTSALCRVEWRIF